MQVIPAGTTPHPVKTQDPKKIHDAAVQFESLLISNLLKSMRESGGSWMGSEEDGAGATAVEMAEEQLAKALSARGGLGIASLVESGLRKTPGHAAQKL